MNNKKSLRHLSCVQTILGSLMIVLVIIGIIVKFLQKIWSFIVLILLAILILVAGGQGFSATSRSPVVNSTRCSVTACMVLSIIAASLSIPVFVIAVFGSHEIGVFITLLTIPLFIAELVVSIWSAVCCGRLGACCCCPQQQAQMVGQAVYYVPNQNGTMSTIQGTPAGTNQAYPSTTSGVVFQPIQAQAQTSKYPPPYPGKEAGSTETNPPPYPDKEAGQTETNIPL